jgi:hypothetical protein
LWSSSILLSLPLASTYSLFLKTVNLRTSLIVVTVIVAVGRDYVFVELRPLSDPLSILQTIHEWIWSSGGMILKWENRRLRRKTCPSDTLSTKNPTRTALGTNSGLHTEEPATNRLSYGTALFFNECEWQVSRP